jgi:ERCC4-type nuclease
MADAEHEGDAIVVDSNAGEGEIFELLHASEPAAVRRQRLDVGDIVLRANGETIIIERKATNDLASSLTDGRYKDQKLRQLAAVAQDPDGKTKLVYIVEGPLMAHDMATQGGVTVRQLECAILKTAVRDAIPVIRVPCKKSLADTVLYLFRELKAGELDGESKAQQRAAAPLADLHVKKAKNVTVPVMWRMALATVPGMSMGKADQFAKQYPGPASLADAIRNLDDRKAVKLIAASDAGGRKLGPKVAERLVQVFRL